MATERKAIQSLRPAGFAPAFGRAEARESRGFWPLWWVIGSAARSIIPVTVRSQFLGSVWSQLLIDGEGDMSIAGEWFLYYSWECSGSYIQTTVAFTSAGKFTDGGGESGQWAVVGGNVQWVYEPTPSAVYSGNVIGGAMCGMMTNFNFGEQGCWYATAAKIPTSAETAKKVEDAANRTASGNRRKK